MCDSSKSQSVEEKKTKCENCDYKGEAFTVCPTCGT